MLPVIEDPELMHIKTLRLGTRAQLSILKDSGVAIIISFYSSSKIERQWFAGSFNVAFLSTPREVLNPSTIAAIRRLKNQVELRLKVRVR